MSHKIRAYCPYFAWSDIVQGTFKIYDKYHEELKDKVIKWCKKKGFSVIDEFPLVYYALEGEELRPEEIGHADVLCYNNDEVILIEIKSYPRDFANVGDIYQLLSYLQALNDLKAFLEKHNIDEVIAKVSKDVKELGERKGWNDPERVAKGIARSYDDHRDALVAIKNAKRIVAKLICRDSESLDDAAIEIKGNEQILRGTEEKARVLQPGEYCMVCKHYDPTRGVCKKLCERMREEDPDTYKLWKGFCEAEA